ncbi:uncharacterized protein [Paramisgurnus dabryanus]|uniref:uncharacterized protein isoform X2 n=1 Tax=Paramisgurnus dabryanus TaxID=90735 RepID=UPI0031F34F02
MSSVQSYKRFSDEQYKNWLKTTESLSILRTHMRDFIEQETETYHSSLRNKQALKGLTCDKKCTFKKNKNKQVPLCPLCNNWKKEIHNNHAKNANIYWENCQPPLWPTNKWEAAKAYMPRGHDKHGTFEEFDVAAILNLMRSCKHFSGIPDSCLQGVLKVRNSAMHSPDFKMSSADMEKNLVKVLEMARKLEARFPELKNLEKDLEKDIKQFNNILDKNFSQDSQCEVDGKQDDIENLKEIQKVLDREQQAMKEKLEGFLLHFEGNNEESVKEQSQDFLDFLDQNKDLLENLAPQVNKLKEMQEKVDQHEHQLTDLNDRVDYLEQVTTDPVLSGNPLRFKNHLYEFCRKNHWPEPKFTEERKAEGYKGMLEVNGQTFEGKMVCNSIKNAHQNVAHIALEYLESEVETTEPQTALTSTEISSSSSSRTHFGKVTVVLDQEFTSGGCFLKEEEAVESAYEDLWKQLQGVMGPVKEQTYKLAILDYFNKLDFPIPTIQFTQNDDNTTICKLRLSGSFTFHDTVGSSKKKQAEQQAAEVAVKHLSKILNCGPISDTEKNFKGLLKERLENLRLKAAEYDTEEGPSGTRPEPSSLCASVKRPSDLESESISTASPLSSCPSHESVSGPVPVSLDPQESCSSSSQRKKAKIDTSGLTFFGKVTVFLEREIVSDGGCSEEEASESAYKVLWQQLCINASIEGKTYKSTILDYFKENDFQMPAEEFNQNDDNTTICKLRLTGPFTFHDRVGSSKKKQAEQQAAKVAVNHLSKILNCDPIPATENFKSLLKERLENLRLKAAEYDTEEGPSGTRPEPSNTSIIQATVKQPSNQEESQSISTASQLPSCQSHESVSGPVLVSLVPQNLSSPASQRKKARIDTSEIDALLTVWNLKAPHVKVENIQYDENFKCTMEINLENFTFTNKIGYDSKKEAIRKTYLLFGCAMGIFEPGTADEKTASAQVKQHFSQKSLPLPQEDFEGSSKPFCCSIKNISYKVVYEEQGSSESEAKLHALQKALSSLSRLFDYPSLTGANSLEDVENQLGCMLKGAGQKDPVISLHGPLVKTSIQLCFTDHTVKCTCKNSKKAARNHLSLRILSLLGEKTDSGSTSVRNCLDDWFKQKNLPQPAFEDTEEALGAKATFSVQFTCCNPAWEDNWDTAKKKLVEELKQRFQFLND